MKELGFAIAYQNANGALYYYSQYEQSERGLTKLPGELFPDAVAAFREAVQLNRLRDPSQPKWKVYKISSEEARP
jgi:hypothetical protein